MVVQVQEDYFPFLSPRHPGPPKLRFGMTGGAPKKNHTLSTFSLSEVQDGPGVDPYKWSDMGN